MNEAGRSALEGQLVATIQENLALYLNENAIFLAERLVAEFPREQNIYLLATCYNRAHQTYRAYHLLKRKKQSSKLQTTLTSLRRCRFPALFLTSFFLLFCYRFTSPTKQVLICNMLHPNG